jgi:hypothetical protein
MLGASLIATLVLIGTACAGAQAPAETISADTRTDAGASAPSPTPSTESVAARALPRGEPTRVVIPAIGVDARLIPVGLEPTGAMEVPDFGLAAWYEKGPRPGHLGPAVITAHVDSWLGPDVFFDLKRLVAGDLVVVSYDSGDVVTFTVTSSEQLPKVALPVASIWPTTNDPLLTLITCGGRFDHSARRYLDNVMVYATLTSHLEAPLG